MKRWALMQGAVCANVVEQEFAPQIGGDWVDVTGLSVGPGSRLVGGEWLAALPAASQTITSRQGKHALANAGLYHPALAAIAALPEPARTKAQIDWEAAYWERYNATVIGMSAALGLGPAELDTLFAQAATL